MYDFKNLKNSKAVYCYEDNIVFGSITDVINYYQYDSNSIYIAMCKYNGSYLGKHFVYLKDLPSGFEYKKHTFKSRYHDKIYQYNKEKTKLINEYDIDKIPKEFCYRNIWTVCSNKAKSAYGYFWSYEKL